MKGDQDSGFRDVNDEATPLLTDTSRQSEYKTIRQRPEDESNTDPDSLEQCLSPGPQVSTSVWATISVLLLGVFVCNADSTLVLATYGVVASDFDDLESGSWLVSAFILAQCVAQPLYGKLSDIYGRKACLQVSYIMFAVGTAVVGMGQSMPQVICGRAIQGAAAAGMTGMVSIIITDLVPLNEVASLRSYANISATTGRSCGGVIGGALTQALGWRWAFLVQVPVVLLTSALVQWRLDLPAKHDPSQTSWQKLCRIDFTGSIFLSAVIFSACFILDMGGQKFAWNSIVIIGMAIVFVISCIAFTISAKLVAEPIFPIRLWTQYAAVTNYMVILLQTMGQFSLISMIPLYFQATNRSSPAAAGAYLIPSFAGNLIGGLIAGYWIKRTGWYKVPTVMGPAMCVLTMLLCYFTWHGHTTVLQDLAILPGGFAAGLVGSSTFVGLAAGVAKEDLAIATSAAYLFFSIGGIAAISSSAAVYQNALKFGLERRLDGVEGGSQIMRRALGDIKYIQHASDDIRELVLPAFVHAFHQVNLMSLGCACVGLVIAIFSQQKSILKSQ
ncbi:unnamed protein product [Zymoseptoria tritici ST99CH_1E4]|uniref:Major facilitator superfamily (MFS) profile domain-containing protein n=1 Tax=Zymoseptoria tritici ST99CH_1E4 TaxID=1276532 RepID=A0A2H1GCV7_ZYMTR|nr:unnamed protein product [Zymoseptoria tritici ST99CH_1E4]